MDHQVSPEPENGHSEEEEQEAAEETSDLNNGPKVDAAKQGCAPAKLFTFSIVNSYGTANISPLPCDGNILKLNRKRFSFSLLPPDVVAFQGLPSTSPLVPAAHSTVAIDWDTELKKQCYDEQEAEVRGSFESSRSLGP